MMLKFKCQRCGLVFERQEAIYRKNKEPCVACGSLYYEWLNFKGLKK